MCLLAHEIVAEADPPRHTKTFLGSEATSHITPHRQLFSSFEETFLAKAVMENESEAEIQGCGTIVLSLNDNGVSKKWFLKNVLYVPNLRFSLVTVRVLCKNRFQILFRKNFVHAFLQGKLCATS